MAYLIQGETITAIANQVRRLTGTSEPLSPAQMAAALNDITPGNADDNYDSFRFFDFSDGVSSLGNNGYDADGNALTPLTALQYLERYRCSPASSTYSSSILNDFNPSIQYTNRNDVIAEIKMPSCTAIGNGALSNSYNLVSVYFPSCMSVSERAFYNCERLESITLNSDCDMDDGAFHGLISPNDKTLRMYLRGNSVGDCNIRAFYNIPYGNDSHPVDIMDYISSPMPGLEIYVPSDLLYSFKSFWCAGYLADNIFALPV